MNTPGQDSWPITLTSFLLIDAAPAVASDVEAAMRFVYWCFMHGDTLTRGTGFAPLPTSVQARLTARLSTIKPRAGGLPRYQTF
jgi:phosphate transport system substrate-binding protein